MTIIYESFRMRYGVRKPAEIFSPRLVPITGFPGMPWNSILHYVGEGVDDYGPTPDNLFLRPYKSAIMVDTITQAKTNKGNPRRLSVNIHAMVKSYHVKNYRMRPLRKWDSVVKDKRMPIVVNYAMFPYTMRYINNFMTTYNRWFNIYSTVWSNVNELALKYDRMHFVAINIPPEMPGIADLRRAETMLDQIESIEPLNTEENGLESFDISVDEDTLSVCTEGKPSGTDIDWEGLPSQWIENIFGNKPEGMSLESYVDSFGLEALTRPVLEVFSNNELLTILDLWTWMGDNRERSVMSLLSDEALKKINFAFMEGGRITVLNLGMLNKMRQDPNKEETKGLQPKQAQRLLLKFIDKIVQLRSVKSSEETELALDEESDELVDVVDDGAEISIDDMEKEIPDVIMEEPPEISTDEIDEEMRALLDSDAEFETPEKVDKTFSAEVNKTLDKLSDETVIKLNRHKLTPDVLARQQADDLAEAGAITAQDYKRIGRLADKYKIIKDPYGTDETLEQLMEIPEDLLKLDPVNQIPADIKGLPDSSMKGITLKAMQKKYLKNVMKRDIVSAVMSIQNEGLMVQNYKVEKVRTFMDEYDIHTVSVVPTKGAPSTVRLKVQHIRDDGTYIANGVKNRLNPQRGDKPIRKISSVEVGLSSYYGKLFVRKAERANFNADRWILNNISARGMDAEDNSITNLMMYKSFKFDQKLPAIYSLLSTQFGGFETEQYTFHTNHDKRHKYFTEEEISLCEVGGETVLIAKKKDGTPIIVDFNNVFYECVGGEQIAIGSIEDMIGVEHDKRPVEILEVGIFGKPIPLGMVLGYHIGFDELIKILKPNIRRVKRVGRTPLNLDKNEFAVVFDDEAVIFEKGNKMIEFIFGGFTRWPKDVARYNIGVFNKPQVYEAIFDRNGLGARYPREIRLLFSSFIDPITRGVLAKMKEPEDLFMLFLRAAEMLTTMEYPAASDMRVMRDKGYERVSGFIYSELMKSMRVFKSKTSPAAKFEINPNAVWLSIIQDSSNALVEDSNPIANMKEQEIVVFGGQGGRGQRSLQGNHRAFHESQMGTTSEATKDSGKVATIVYTSADPKYADLRGMTEEYNNQEDGPSRLVSPSFLLAPASDRDD